MLTSSLDLDATIDRCNAVLKYIELMPGLLQAVTIGHRATPLEFYTTLELVETLNLPLTAKQIQDIDNIMATLCEVLTLCKPGERTVSLAAVNHTSLEYPGYLFPFFLAVLTSQGISFS